MIRRSTAAVTAPVVLVRMLRKFEKQRVRRLVDFIAYGEQRVELGMGTSILVGSDALLDRWRDLPTTLGFDLKFRPA